MKFKNYFLSLSEQEQCAYAARAQVSRQYIQVHLLKPRRVPRPKTMAGLVRAARGAVSWEEMLQHFYGGVLDGYKLSREHEAA